MSKEDLERQVQRMKEVEKDPVRDKRVGSFQSLSSAIKTASHQSGLLSVPDRQPPDRRVDECSCKACGKKFQGEVLTYTTMSPPKEIRDCECPECKKSRLEKDAAAREVRLEELREPLRERWRKECGMPEWLRVKTFDNWDTRHQIEAYKAAKEWASGFNMLSPRGYPSLIFYSENPGVGKGHLMTGIVNYLLDHWKGDPLRTFKCPIRFESGPSLVRRIRATYHIRPKDDKHEREDEVYASLANVLLLLLDDVGKEPPSDFTRTTYWYIIDERVKAGLPVIISSRLPFEGHNSLTTLMGVDTVDRLCGMTGKKLIVMQGESYRKSHGVA